MTVALRSLVATIRASGGVTVGAVANSLDSVKVLTAAVVTAYATYVTDAALFATALATCVSDGATPTQAHVTAANSAYTTLAADWATVKAAIDAADTAQGAAVTAGGHKLTVTFDVTDINTSGALRAAFNEIIEGAAAAGYIRS